MLSELALGMLLVGGALPAVASELRAQAVPVAAPAVTTADIQFMQDMMGHHRQAVEMTALVARRSRRGQMQMLAERIAVSQTDELAMMRQWLTAHGPTADTAMSQAVHDMGAATGHDMTTMPLMPGMLSARGMAAIRAAQGPRFDRLFLLGMIRHHGGALTMVAALLATPNAAQESSINRFVIDVAADQRAEILRMRRMLITK